MSRGIFTATLVFFPVQPFEGNLGMHVTRAPSVQGFDSNGVQGHPLEVIGREASRGDGNTFFHRIDTHDGFELPLELHASLFEETYIRAAITDQFVLETKQVAIFHLLRMPCQKFGFPFRRHAIGIEVMDVGHVSHIILIGSGVEEMRKKTFLQFGQAKCAWEVRQGHGKKNSASR